MASGETITQSLADSLPTWISAARLVRDYEGVVPQLCDVQTLGAGIGTTWNEISLANLTAQAITETTTLKNYQQLSDTLLTVTPTVIGLATVITDRVALRVAGNVNSLVQSGSLMQKAIQRKKDEDGLTAIDGATTTLAGAGETLTSGVIGAGVKRASSNATEPANPPFYSVLHGYQIYDIEKELVAGVGTYNVQDGLTARVFAEGFRGMIGGAQVYEDGNITIDSGDDAKGGVFPGGPGGALILVQGFMPRAEIQRLPDYGGGATAIYHYDEYAYGERSSGNWLFEIQSDAASPTS